MNRLHIDLSHLTVADLSLNKYISQWGHGYESECLPRRDEILGTDESRSVSTKTNEYADQPSKSN